MALRNGAVLPLPTLFLFRGRPLGSASRTERHSLALILGSRHGRHRGGQRGPCLGPRTFEDPGGGRRAGWKRPHGRCRLVRAQAPPPAPQAMKEGLVGGQPIPDLQFLLSRGHGRALLERPHLARTSERPLKRAPLSILSKTNCCWNTCSFLFSLACLSVSAAAAATGEGPSEHRALLRAFRGLPRGLTCHKATASCGPLHAPPPHPPNSPGCGSFSAWCRLPFPLLPSLPLLLFLWLLLSSTGLPENPRLSCPPRS